jgi:hypothetical protein
MSKQECKHGVWYVEINGWCKDCRIEELEGANSRYHTKLEAAELSAKEANEQLSGIVEQLETKWCENYTLEQTIERMKLHLRHSSACESRYSRYPYLCDCGIDELQEELKS